VWQVGKVSIVKRRARGREKETTPSISWKIKSSGTTYQMHSSSLTYFCLRTENTRKPLFSSRLIFFVFWLLSRSFKFDLLHKEEKIWRNGLRKMLHLPFLRDSYNKNWIANGAELDDLYPDATEAGIIIFILSAVLTEWAQCNYRRIINNNFIKISNRNFSC
jgi:hypothetical protein